MNRSVHCAGAFLFLAIASGTALGQEYQLRHYGVADGLAHGVVHSIYQDSKGYIWFGTREGLSRFDGYSFVNYGEREGLTQELVNDVTQDMQGRVWVATNGAGVALFLGDGQVRSAGKFKTFLIVKHANAAESKSGENSVNRILCDSQDNLWALTDAGLFRAPLSDPDLKFEAIKTDSLRESSAAFKDSSGRLWFGYGKELLELHDGQLINHGTIAGQLCNNQVINEFTDWRTLDKHKELLALRYAGLCRDILKDQSLSRWNGADASILRFWTD